jgi:hypothetical protein
MCRAFFRELDKNGGIIFDGAKLLFTFAETNSKITVIVRRPTVGITT